MKQLLCIVCWEEAEFIYGGDSYCEQHFCKAMKRRGELLSKRRK